METRQTLGLIGSILLVIGVFMPIVSLPIIGSINYFQNGHGDGVIVLILGVISLILTLTKKYGALWFTGLGSLAVMAFTFINFQMRMSQAREEMQRALGNNPFRGLADAALQTIQIQWGWAVLVLGAALVIAAAIVKSRSSRNPEF